MRLPLSARIAARYLFAPKSHSAVTAISAISIAGIAVATAAIICVLSVFNGFRDIIIGKTDTLAPDVLVAPSSGKTFADADSLAEALQKLPEVAIAAPTVADNALVIYQGREMPVYLKGVTADAYRRVTAVDTILLEGSRFETVDTLSSGGQRVVYDEDIGDYIALPAEERYAAVISIGVAARLRAVLGENLLVFAPRRQGRVNTANLANSFVSDSLKVAGVFQAMQDDYDADYIITDIALARYIFQYEGECTGVDIKAAPGVTPTQAAEAVRRALGDRAVVKDRLQQQEVNFRMISIEKWMAFLLLAFILVVASFNIISTMSMLVIDKQGSLYTLHALGATRRRIGAVFAWESVYVTLFGCGAGMIAGIALCLLQEHFGLIKLAGDPSTLIIQAYPVALEWGDLLTVLIPIVLIGSATALLSYRFALTRISARN